MSIKLCQLIVLAVCFRAAPALAQWYWPPDFGMASDCTISIGGQWPDSCTPRGPTSVQVTPGRLDITIDHGYPADAICLAVIRDWSGTATLPPGTSGRYEVYLSFTSLSRPAIEPALAGTMTVSCAGACVADLDDGSGSGASDGAVTIDDLVYFLGRFEAGDTRADVAAPTARPGTMGPSPSRTSCCSSSASRRAARAKWPTPRTRGAPADRGNNLSASAGASPPPTLSSHSRSG